MSDGESGDELEKCGDVAGQNELLVMWRDIDCAPIDGTKILVCTNHLNLYAPETAYFGAYHPNAKGKEHWRAGSARTKVYPTHWMPLPNMPTT